jgi:hypothetical protein
MLFKYSIKFNRNPAKLMMVGDGPEKKKAEYLCQELGIWTK